MAAGTVSVNFVANTKRFSKGVKGARKDLGGFNKSLLASTKSLLGFGKGLIAVATVGGFAVFFKSQIQAIDTLATTAQKLGIATAELELLRFAAIKTNVSISTFDEGLQRMVRRIAQAAMGTGEAQASLKKFNIRAKELVKLAPEKQWAAISKHIRAIAIQGQKLPLVMSFFDTDAVKLVNTMSLDMAKVRQEFEDLGGATSTKGIENVAKFVDATNNLKQALSVSGRKLVIGITDPAIATVKRLAEMLKIVTDAEKKPGAAPTPFLDRAEKAVFGDPKNRLKQVGVPQGQTITEFIKQQASALDRLFSFAQINVQGQQIRKFGGKGFGPQNVLERKITRERRANEASLRRFQTEQFIKTGGLRGGRVSDARAARANELLEQSLAQLKLITEIERPNKSNQL